MKTKLAFPKVKRVKKSTMKKKAWDMFSKWVRISNMDSKGEVNCYTCGKTYPWKEVSAGHGIGGRTNFVLFDERLVKPQCAGCNIWGRGQYQIFTWKLIKELGMEEWQKIIEATRVPVQYKTSDYQAIYEKYKAKIAEMGISL